MLDTNLIFDGTAPNTGVAITVTRVSTNVLDFLAKRDPGAGWSSGLNIHVQILETFTTGDAAVLQIAFQASPDNSTWKDVMLSPLLAVANLVVGAKVFRLKWPNEQLNELAAPGSYARYFRLNYTVTVGSFTAGKVFSYVSGGNDRQEFTAYPNNFTVGA